MAELRERLVQLREERNILQKDVAKDIGMSIVGYQRYEYGTRKPDSDIIIKLADYFRCSTDYLLGRTERDWLAERPDAELPHEEKLVKYGITQEQFDEAEDEWLMELVTERKKNDTGVRYTHEEILAERGLTVEDIDRMLEEEDVELEYELPV